MQGGIVMNMQDRMKRVPVSEQAPEVRAKNFEEVCLGYIDEEAIQEANRCLTCKNPKCVDGCPVSINIPGFISYMKNGEFEKAAKEVAKYSALPAVCGRVCPQESQCEGKCVLGIKGEPVSIGKLERFIADWSRKHNVELADREEDKNKKVAVIGSGPAGLTCAGDLAKKGYDVTIFEALHEPGGVLVYGIPEFRLPKDDVVRAEIENIKKLGVKIETNVIIGRTITIDELMEDEGFEAVFIGSGAGLPKFMGISGENANGVLSANEYGVLQNRKRIILVGKRGHRGKKSFYPEIEKLAPEATVLDLLKDLPKINAGGGKSSPLEPISEPSQWLKDAQISTDLPLTWHEARPHSEQDLEIYKHAVNLWNTEKRRLHYDDLPEHLKSHKGRNSFVDRFKVVAGDLTACHTIVAHISKDGHHYIHPDINQNRSLTPREAARIQSFPDDYYFENVSGKPARTSAFKQIGNAVPVLLAQKIAEKLLKDW